jgi:uncharacterized membrane protein HdeD (DUF308 family)
MKFVLFLLSVVSFLLGLAIFFDAKNAVHEIEAYILFLLFAVCLSGAGIIEAIHLLRKEIMLGNNPIKSTE